MQKRLLILTLAGAFVAVACTNQGGGTSAAPGGSGPAGTPAGTGTGGGEFDPSTISGDVNLGQWESSPAEGEALAATIEAFEAAYPNITVEQETISGDYRAQMVTRFGARDVPDLFYVNAEYAPEWIEEGFLDPLDTYITDQG